MSDSVGCSCAQVKVDATMALRPFMEEYEEEDIAALKPLIPQLLNEIFKLMSEVRCNSRQPSLSRFLLANV